MSIEVIKVDYANPTHTEHLLLLLNEYAQDPMGGGAPIASTKQPEIIAGLQDFPTSFSLLAYHDLQPAALANCFFGFSTFAGQKLINIHDLMVRKHYRGQGLSQKLLESIEKIGRENHCCKLTLEVLTENKVAMNSYMKFGFGGYELDPDTGHAVFWQKKLE